MANIVKPIFLRPVEYVPPSTGSAFTITVGSTVEVDATDFPGGVYANVAALAHAFCVYCDEKSGGDIVPDYRFLPELCGYRVAPTLALFADKTCTLAWGDTTLRNLLGFTASVVLPTSPGYAEAGYPAGRRHPNGPFIWTPSFGPSDKGRWTSNPGETVSGTYSKNGSFAGTAVCDPIYHRQISFPLILTADIVDEGQANSSIYTSLESFLRKSLSTQTTISTGCSAKGFWFYPDLNDFLDDADGVQVDNPWNVSAGTGIHFESGDEWRCFCVAEKDTIQPFDGEAAQNMSALRYNYTFSMHTCDTPVFQPDFDAIIVV